MSWTTWRKQAEMLQAQNQRLKRLNRELERTLVSLGYGNLVEKIKRGGEGERRG